VWKKKEEMKGIKEGLVKKEREVRDKERGKEEREGEY
jgi:hypothetical protein